MSGYKGFQFVQFLIDLGIGLGFYVGQIVVIDGSGGFENVQVLDWVDIVFDCCSLVVYECMF